MNRFWALLCLMTLTFSCQQQLVEEPNFLQADVPCFADENGNCDGITPIGGGSTGGSSSTNNSLPSERFQVFHRGENTSRIFSSYSADGQESWKGDFSLNSGAELDDSSIDAAIYGNRVVVVHQGRTSNKIYYSFSSDGRNFSNDKALLTGARTNGTIRTVAFDGRVFIYHHDQYINRIRYNVSSNGSVWTGNQHILNREEFAAFDFVVVGNRLFLFTIDGNNFEVFTSQDGINFSTFLRTALLPGNYRNLSVAKSGSDIHLLTDRGALNDRQILYGRFRPNSNNPTGIGSSLMPFHQIGVTFTEVIRFPPAVLTTENAKTDQPPSIAANDDVLVITYERKDGNGIVYAYNDDFKQIPLGEPLENWSGGHIGGATKKSGVEVLLVP